MNKYLRLLRSGNIPVEDLVIQKRLSKNPKEYKHMVLQAIAANQLAKENAEVNAGQFISFVITSNRSKLQNNRVLAFDLCRNYHTYDAEAYINLLLSAVETILTPFGFDKTRLS
jgi:DNA polymerase elongation subunit (family B)